MYDNEPGPDKYVSTLFEILGFLLHDCWSFLNKNLRKLWIRVEFISVP